MTDQDLLALDKIGFIPGPGETESQFLARVAKAKKDFAEGKWIPESHWDWVREFLDQLYYVKPLYMRAFYSNKNLAPWQGAAAWVEGRVLFSIQLREGLRKGSYLGLYQREEILAHEAVHAARSGFNEPIFEEFFAYMTSEKKWRRVLGPIVQRPWEIWPLLIFMGLGIVWQGAYLAATIWVGLGFFRLIQKHRCLRKAAKNILEKTQDQKNGRAILFRLTDDEIKKFAKGQDIELFAEQQTCLRWRILRNYLKGDMWQKKL
jgi:hypothetical protein